MTYLNYTKRIRKATIKNTVLTKLYFVLKKKLKKFLQKGTASNEETNIKEKAEREED